MANGNLVFCPVCDRGYLKQTRELGLAFVDSHVRQQHPEYVPMTED